MAKTSNSSDDAYATPADLLLRHDERQVADCLLDNNTRAASGSISTSDVVLAALDDASGMVELAALKGGRYSSDDLNALTGVSQKLLIKLVCELAFWGLTNRRHPAEPMTPIAMWAMQTLDQLGTGEKIFSFVENEQAGNPKDAFLTIADAQRLQLCSLIANRFFGTRTMYSRPFGQ